MVDELLAAGPEAQARIKAMIHRFAREDRETYRRSTPRQIAEARTGEEGQAGLASFFDKTLPPWAPKPAPLEPPGPS